jgi:O-antigen ligase
MSVELLFGFTALAAVSLFWSFVRLERAGHSVWTVLLVLWILVLDASLYADPNEVPVGLFHPGVGRDPDPTDEILESAISFRLVDLVIPIAVGARLYARGLPERIRMSSVWLLAFFAWLVGAAVIGVLNANASNLIAFELKALIYLGIFGLVASVPIRTFVEGRGLPLLIYGSATIAAALIVMDGMSLSFALDLPLLPLPHVGTMGADAAGIFVPLGVIAFCLALVSAQRRLRLFVAAGPLLLSPVVASQRAAIITLVVALGVFALGAFATRRRVQARPTEFALLGTLVLGLAFLPPAASLALGSHDARFPFEAEVEETFTSRAKQQSAQSRVNQWRKAGELIEERPVTGWGLGKTYIHYDAGHYQFFETNYTHNIGGDLLIRTGAIGLMLFTFAVVLALLDGLAAWLRHPDDTAAVLAFGAVAIISGLLARGMVESLFEKYRLATMLGITLGIVGSVAVEPVRARFAQRLQPKAEKAWSSGTSFAR